MRTSTSLVFLWAALSCGDAPDTDADCQSAFSVSTWWVPAEGGHPRIADGDLTVHAAISVPGYGAIERVSILGNAATLTDGSWQAPLAHSVLVDAASQADAHDGQAEVRVPIEATDVNGCTEAHYEDIQVELDPDGWWALVDWGVQLGDQDCTLETCILPADGSQRLQVSFEGPGLAAGEEVGLAVEAALQTAGTEAAGTTATGTLSGSTTASAGFWVAGVAAGTAGMVASAGDWRDTLLVQVQGPPAFSTAEFAVPPGTTIELPVWTDGSLASCAAHRTGAGDIEVDLLGQAEDLVTSTQAAGEATLSGVSEAVFSVRWGEDAVEGTTIRLSCTDTLGQQATAALNQGDVEEEEEEEADSGDAGG